MMIGYVTLGTNDMEGAARFYDPLFKTIGAGRAIEGEGFIAWSTGPGNPALSVIKPFDGNDATIGNGVMVALAMPSREAVDKFYTKAIELGASDEGEPGIRFGSFYAGYFRDVDGNKLNAFCMIEEEE
jgi:catechol-2,3-dioxygenase